METSGAPYRSVAERAPLRAPPRRVPRGLELRLLLGGRLALAGWLVLLFATIPTWAMTPHIDFSPWTVHGPYQRVDGEIVASEATLVRENDREIHRVSFVFGPDGARHFGTSYSRVWPPGPGTRVQVEVPVGRPDQAVIVGMRRRPFGWGLVFVALGFPLAGIGLVGHRLWRGRQEVRLLATGRLGAGRLIHRVDTNVRVNGRRVQKLSFDFEDHQGRVRRVEVRAADPARLVDETLEPLVYDPVDPRRAALLDALPGEPRVGADGQLAYDASPWSVLAALGLPLLVVALNGFCALLVLVV